MNRFVSFQYVRPRHGQRYATWACQDTVNSKIVAQGSKGQMNRLAKLFNEAGVNFPPMSEVLSKYRGEFKVFVATQGDRSVGIPAQDITINFQGWDSNQINDFGREIIKSSCQRFVQELFDEKAGASLEDECHDCGHRRQYGERCPNPHCISNIPDEN